ncbi:SDR family oxidoreductase [Bacillus chungangensis]|uniref:NAD(P)-dependent dehydrogenase (Short-subunit alcohol dehydrogenase family) n=1 Tax=Bacillus chungangensis TaxID=587633 RepID=A0ABT9WNA5_9BACI|nr:SDR family oxidoreductase [Bacillus chungangensis]MDQ0174680.1 NAD(P)-dependent dehydrogenase (short-subunit alcohol dehydrogenase family) [Bacillus chungangensis]
MNQKQQDNIEETTNLVMETQMDPPPESVRSTYKGSGKLNGKIAIITGGDSGIGQSVSIYFAKEGADIAICYLSKESASAQKTKQLIEAEGRKCLLLPGDLGNEAHCQEVVKKVMDHYGKIDILVNNAGIQHLQDSILDISSAQLEKTFQTNFFSYFYMAKAVLPHLHKGSSIINTSSLTAYEGNAKLIDYSASKGAIAAFTRSLALSLASREIRVNSVAPGPIWTPLITTTNTPEAVAVFGKTQPMERAGQPAEVAPAYVYLASEDASYVTGQTLHVNGGGIVNG